MPSQSYRYFYRIVYRCQAFPNGGEIQEQLRNDNIRADLASIVRMSAMFNAEYEGGWCIANIYKVAGDFTEAPRDLFTEDMKPVASYVVIKNAVDKTVRYWTRGCM